MGLERRQTCEKRPFNNPRSPRLRNPDQLRRGERYPSLRAPKQADFNLRRGLILDADHGLAGIGWRVSPMSWTGLSSKQTTGRFESGGSA